MFRGGFGLTVSLQTAELHILGRGEAFYGTCQRLSLLTTTRTADPWLARPFEGLDTGSGTRRSVLPSSDFDRWHGLMGAALTIQITMSDSSIPGAGETAEPKVGPTSDSSAAEQRPRRTSGSSDSQFDTPDSPKPFGGGLDSDKASSRTASAEGSPEGTKTKRGSRRRPRRRKPASTSGEAAEQPEAADQPELKSDAEGPTDGEGEVKAARRRRGTRGGRRRKKKRPEGEGAESGEGSEESQAEAKAEAKAEKAPKPPSRGRKKSIKKTARRSKTRRSGKSSDSQPVSIEAIPGEDDDLPELIELPMDAELVGEEGGKKRKRRGRKTKTKGKSEDEDSEISEVEELPRDEVILVNACDKLESRVAVVRDGRIGDLFLEVNRVQSYVHNIYRGKVVNIESAIGAAFVDFGQGKNGFLHVSDVLTEYGEADWNLTKLLEAREGDEEDLSKVESDLVGERDENDESEEGEDEASEEPKSSKRKSAKSNGRGRKGREGSRPSIGDLLKVGDKVVVQITKDAIGDKGPALTTYISIPGRFLVLMPSLEMVGVSRKIEDEKERKRLRKIMQSFDVPGGMGLIVRTAGVGKTKADLNRDLVYLMALWESFSKRLLHGRTPCALYQENDLAIRTMRDMFTRRTSRVVVDDEGAHQSMIEFASKLMPEHVDRIERHDGDRPLFHTFGVEQDYEKIFVRRVDLPSGGSIVIDQTEALVAIDVNSGRTRGEGAVFEDIALKTNLEAVAEISLQIKLRDLGGILVLDFIDMMRKSSRLAVERALRDAMSPDRARHKVGRISQFGLLELTRQRLGPGLSKLIYTTCLTCRGTGRQRTPEARAQGILRRLGSALTQKGFTKVEVRTQPEVIEYLKAHCRRDLDELSTTHKRELELVSATDQLEESVLRYLRTDGREVRPGGRRKKR